MTADQAYVLTPRDVRQIRNYVLNKYAGMPSRKRAEIVADAVSRIIYRQLPDFDGAVKHALTSQLIRTIVLEENRSVRSDDIFQLCMELDHNDEAIRRPLDQWVREQERKLQSTAELSTGEFGIRDWSSESPINAVAMPDSHNKRMRRRVLTYGLLCLLIVASITLYTWQSATPILQGGRPSVVIPVPQQQHVEAPPTALNELPAGLRYAEVDRERLMAYLSERNSLLAEKHYLDAILNTAEQFDIHPALLFAITGQEQGFVPVTHKKAKQIANNPFNVFHSWEEFNTNIEQSSAIAARTINRLSKDRPSDVDPIVWINREYAEDPNWSKGVSLIMRDIEMSLDGS
ncbi:glucosaminidase domain-containing protein [Paenibacillus agaridevorans]|uniref:glucosaminidase domain-containing protein n=1 Tax=Paenibacillus agaridevorans TaxID=171404 RepID=UPI001BE4BD12|nr:glucosaminidase domain-containing protein [Paenibacillus agaridevorans]